MAIAICWNCGATLKGPKCQMCGAAQTASGASGAAPGGQPIVSQASMSVRPPQPPANSVYQPGGQYPPAAQPGAWQNQPTVQGQAPGWQGQATIQSQAPGWQGYQQPQGYAQPQGYPQPGYQQPMSSAASYQQSMPGAAGYQQPMPGPAGYQQPMPGPAYGAYGPAAPVFQPVARARGPSQAQSLLLAALGGLVGGIIGAIIWAFVLQLTKTNISYVAIGLGFLVGLGVMLGARGRFHVLLLVLAGVLGLLAFFLALYFRLSLLISGEGNNLFALPLGNFFSVLGQYLQDNPINYIYFAAVPLIAILTPFRMRRRR